MVTLIVPADAADYPIAHGIERFHPYRADHADPASVWLIDVPEHVAVHLLHVGGFSVAKSKSGPAGRPGDLEDRVVARGEPGEGQVESASPLARMHHAEGVGCSYAGTVYAPDQEGAVSVPHAAVATLMAHGFSLWPPPAPPPPIADDGRTAPVVPRRDWPADPLGTPHPEAQVRAPRR